MFNRKLKKRIAELELSIQHISKHLKKGVNHRYKCGDVVRISSLFVRLAFIFESEDVKAMIIDVDVSYTMEPVYSVTLLNLRHGFVCNNVSEHDLSDWTDNMVDDEKQ